GPTGEGVVSVSGLECVVSTKTEHAIDRIGSRERIVILRAGEIEPQVDQVAVGQHLVGKLKNLNRVGTIRIVGIEVLNMNFIALTPVADHERAQTQTRRIRTVAATKHGATPSRKIRHRDTDRVNPSADGKHKRIPAFSANQ